MAAGMEANFDLTSAQGDVSLGDQSATDNSVQDTAKPDYLRDDARVFVSYLPPKVTWQQLRGFFTKFGEVVYAKVFVDHFTRLSKGHGYVRFSTLEAAQRASRARNRDLRLCGRTLKVKLASSNSQRTVKRPSLNFDINLGDLDITDEDYDVDPESLISILNDDSLVHILSFLTPVQRISVERVCKRWRRCARLALKQEKHVGIVRHAKNSCGFTNTCLRKVLLRCSWNLVSLDISRETLLNNKALYLIAQYCPKIERLNMTMVFANNHGIEALTKACPNLRWLCIANCLNITDKGFKSIFENCPKMEYLDCSDNAKFDGRILSRANACFKGLIARNCHNLANEGLMQLANKCHQMETLDITGCELLTYRTISDLIKRMPCLKVLDIGDVPGIDETENETCQHAVKYLINPRIITKLTLFNCGLGDSDLQLVCGSCPMVSDLDISLNRLTNMSVCHVAALKRLEYLNACYLYTITDDSLLGVVMQGKLRRLLLQFCSSLTDNLMKVVAERCRDLEELDVAGILGITDQTLTVFKSRPSQPALGCKLTIYTAHNRINEKPKQFQDINVTRIESYRPLYPGKLQIEMDLGLEEIGLEGHDQHLRQLRQALICNGMLVPNMEQGHHWRLFRGDLVDSDEDSDYSDDFEDYLAYDYLDNDDFLAEEFWAMS